MDLHLLLPLILIPAKLLEGVLRRLGIPAVVGAILAGVLLGPAVIGILPSQIQDLEEPGLLNHLADIGLCVLLFRIGLETRLSDFLPDWRSAMGIAIAGMALPFALGFGVTVFWGWSLQAAVFVGATLTATSIGITAATLSELRAEKSKEGTLILAAAILDDVFGLILLAMLVALVTPALSVVEQVLIAIGQAVAFIMAGVLIGPYIAHIVISLSKWIKTRGLLLVLAFSYLLLMAYAARAAGLQLIIGAYAAGLAFAQHPEREQVEQDLKPLTELLTPVFFVLLGASVEFSGFDPFSSAGREGWSFAALLFIAAATGKLFSASWMRSTQINRWAIGSGMMPRGEVGFVFAQIGLMAGVLSSGIFSSLVLVLIATSILGPILLKTFWRD